MTAIDAADKILKLMTGFEIIVCGCCLGSCCGDSDCQQRFAEQARKMVQKEEEHDATES